MATKPTGRPPKYETPEEMQPLIDKYFDDCDARGEPYTVPGIADDLGFESRQSLFDYGKKPEFSYTLKKAKQRIERQRNITMLKGEGSAAGHIFDLKNNFGWVDKTETEHTGNIVFNANATDIEI